MILSVKSKNGTYPVIIEKGSLEKAGEVLSLSRKCLIVTDENIPKEYVDTLSSQCDIPFVFTLKAGEEYKSLESLNKIVSFMLEKGFDRKSCVVALGGGVVGDLAGFVASVFLRGVDFYNIPTTTLSQIDSSIGGKVAVNFQGLKNMVGAFYPPKGVLVYPATLKSLSQRQIASGLAEAVKMSLCFDEDLFALFEKGEELDLVEIIGKSLQIKKKVVEEDERESGVRKVLNFGHSLGHAIENKSFSSAESLYHGECVALGMIPMCSDPVRERLLRVLKNLNLPTEIPYELEDLFSALSHDKKMAGGKITAVFVDEVGSFRLAEQNLDEFQKLLKERMQ